MEDIIAGACKAREIPGVVLLASDVTGRLPHYELVAITDDVGNFRYSRSFGVRSIEDEEPLEIDTPMWIASLTKLLTAIAAMQCVDKGLLELDGDITLILHELENCSILTGFDEISGESRLEKRKSKLTLRKMLNHTSGLTYGFFNPLLRRWREMNGTSETGGETVVERFLYPAIFEPETSWDHSCSIDWIGKAVERVNGNVSLDSYMQKHLWTPLGIKKMTFHLNERPDLEGKIAELCTRSGKDISEFVPKENEMIYRNPQDDFGGGGIIGSPTGFLKVLRSLLANDGILLKPETLREFFKPQLNDRCKQALMKRLENVQASAVMGGLPSDAKKDWAFAGLVNCGDLEGRRRKGSVTFTGLPNLAWVSSPQHSNVFLQL